MSRPNPFQPTRDAVFQWAVRAHRATLTAGVDRYFGADRRTEDAASHAVSFALHVPDESGVALFQRYAAAHPNRPRVQREALAMWGAARFGIWVVDEVELDRGFHLFNVVTEEEIFVSERAGTHQVPERTWLYGLVVPRDGHLELEGTLGALPGPQRIHAVQAALPFLGGDAATSRRALGPVIDAIHRARRVPRLLNTDEHDLELLTATLDRAWDEVAAVVARWPDAHPNGKQLDIVGETPRGQEAVGGPVVRGSYSVEGGAVTLFTNSRARQEELLARLGASLPVDVVSERREAVPSNPDGPTLWIDAASLDAEEAERRSPAEVMAARRGREWADEPIPALDGLTPRQAVATGRRAEVRALLPDEPEVADALAVELGI